ncbi:uncharacterized protein LOC143146631 [Ptiloglossa arizonensis]|uniref:uncharacterized protein LOC143146631 n=1 Tax=Ptiloglossa arizonensis TaxID=3350558 RepID=UPI003F9F9CDA
MADSNTGYICGILPYYGSLTTEKLIRPDLPISTRIPLHLYTMLLEKVPGSQGRHMFTDRYYTSAILAEELLKLKCHLSGTILTNRKHLPNQIKKPKFGRKSTVAFRKGNTLVLSWKDKRVVTCSTNWNNAGMTSVKRMLRGGVENTVKKPNVRYETSRVAGWSARKRPVAQRVKTLPFTFQAKTRGLEIINLNHSQIVHENIEKVYIYHNEIRINVILNPFDIKSDLDKANRLIDNIKTTCKGCNNVNTAYLTEKVHRLNTEYTRLSTLLHRRAKRGILNIIGTASKALFGTLDEEDLTLINQNIDKLFDENAKLSKIIRNQTATFRTILNSQTLPHFIQQYEKFTLDTHDTEKTLGLLLLAEIIITDIRENIDNLQETITLGKHGIIRQEIIDPTQFMDAYGKILHTHLIVSHISPEPHNFQTLIDISQLKIYLTNQKIIYSIIIPILEENEWTHTKLYTIPYKKGSTFVAPLLKHEHLLKASGQFIPIDIAYLDHYCKPTSLAKICKRTQPTQNTNALECTNHNECLLTVSKVRELTFLPMYAPNAYIILSYQNTPSLLPHFVTKKSNS